MCKDPCVCCVKKEARSKLKGKKKKATGRRICHYLALADGRLLALTLVVVVWPVVFESADVNWKINQNSLGRRRRKTGNDVNSSGMCVCVCGNGAISFRE